MSETNFYKLVGADNQTYDSDTKGQFGGHRKLKIYGRLDCPSALRHIKNGHYTQHRVFFQDEQTALAAGYRPCGVCMKEHYRLWKEGKLMGHALTVRPVLNDEIICSVRLADGSEKFFSADKLGNCQIMEKLRNGIEYSHMEISGNYCIILLSDEKSQWGYTVVWDYVRDRLVHLANTPYVIASAIVDSRIVNLYLVQYWGHPADLWYSVSPLEMADAQYEPDRIHLDIPVDDSVKDESACKITVENGRVQFQAGENEESVTI